MPKKRRNWWIADCGTNMLEPGNLPDHMVLDFLYQYGQAKLDFVEAIQDLPDLEKQRFIDLKQDHPVYFKELILDPREREDDFQKRWNTCLPKVKV
jgi:hypothetical protein